VLRAQDLMGVSDDDVITMHYVPPPSAQTVAPLM
jgi:hypothetical protein